MRAPVPPPPPHRWPVVVLALAFIAGLLWWLSRREEAASAPPNDAVATDEARAYTGPRARAEPVVDLLRLGQRASITGSITDKQGRPLAGAQVCATAQSKRLATSETRRPSCAKSGRDGHYRIEGLFPVRHGVTASAAGHIPARFSRGEGAKRREFVELRASQEATGVDLQLEGGGVEIHGVIKDLSGGPIEGAIVSAGDGDVAFTDADGRFNAWVRPGVAWVSAQADGYTGGYAEGHAPGHVFEVFLTPESVVIGKVVRASDGSPVEGARVTASTNGWGSAAFTDASGNFRIDGLEPGPYKPRAESDDTVGTAAEQTILGLGETSAPIVVTVHPAFYVEGAIVVAGGGDSCDQSSVSLSEKAANRTAWAEDEGDGLLRARGLLPGDYEVTLRCPGFVPEERYAHVIVTDRSIGGLRWQVSRGQAIRGTVLDAGGKPVPKVNVRANAKSDPSQPRAHQTASWAGETDDRGRFELAGLLPGKYTIGLSAWSPQRATPPKPVEVTLPKGQDLDDLKLELPGTGEVKGSVLDAKGRPIAKVQLSIGDGKQSQSTHAADDGRFSFPYVAAGEYRVTARRGWNDTIRAPGTGDDDVQGEKVSVRAGGVAEVKLIVESRANKISGIVRDADGAPVADAFVEATRESTSATKAAGGATREGRWGGFFSTPHLTDQDGRFTIDELADGKHTIRAHRRGGGEAIAEHVEAGGDVVLTIAGTGRMSGTVVAPGGDVPEEFSVFAQDESTGFGRYDTFFRTGGAWSLPELPAGKYKLKVSAGPGSAELEASMTAGQDTTGVRVELAPKVTVRGTVIDLEGKPVAGMSVSIDGGGSWGAGDQEKRNVTDEAGRYEVTHAPTGKVTVRVSPRNWQDSTHDGSGMPTVITASGDAVELPPIRVSKRRLERGEAAGDFGHSYKESEPGADPLLRRHIVAVVRPGSPAAAAGLKAGDEVVSIDGQDVTGPNAYLLYSLTRVPPGTVVNFGLAGGTSVAVTAGQRP